jgi:hypothetical protein
VAPGLATCGLIESMATDTVPACAPRSGLACAAVGVPSKAAMTAAGQARAAARDSVRRVKVARAKPYTRTLGMLLPINPNPCFTDTLDGRA